MIDPQAPLPLKTWGGKRPGAGRKRSLPRPGVAHRGRSELAARHPVHVTIRLRAGLPTLRARKVAAVVRSCLAAAAERFEARLIHYSLQREHLHMLMEAADARALARAVKGLSIRIAKAMNRLTGARGQVVPDRYDARILKSPLEVKRALVYVLQNARKHLGKQGLRIPWAVDPFSSAATFDGWSQPVAPATEAPPLPHARTWLLRVGWRRYGLISPSEAPALP